MRLSYPLFSQHLRFSENEAVVSVIENPDAMQKFVSQLLCQSNGGEGDFILSKNYDPIDIKKNIDVICDIFSVDVNQKKILSGLSSTVKSVAVSEDNYSATAALLSAINQYFLDLQSAIEYPIEMPDFDVDMLVKAASLKLDYNADSLLESLTAYMLVAREFCGYEIFAFVNLKTFLSEEDLLELYQFAAYKKINLLLIESTERKHLQQEKIYLIDNDLCEI